MFFFFEQKTAYEMRISDWSSDVCSSDLLGGKPLMWKTGHSLIKSKMKEVHAPLAGEMSGHIFFAQDYYGFDDALYAAVRLMRAVRSLGGSLTAIKVSGRAHG